MIVESIIILSFIGIAVFFIFSCVFLCGESSKKYNEARFAPLYKIAPYPYGRYAVEQKFIRYMGTHVSYYYIERSIHDTMEDAQKDMVHLMGDV